METKINKPKQSVIMQIVAIIQYRVNGKKVDDLMNLQDRFIESGFKRSTCN